MFLYVAGSLLFLSAMICALAVTFTMFRSYRDQMIAALRSLSLDSVHEQKRTAAALHSTRLRSNLV